MASIYSREGKRGRRWVALVRREGKTRSRTFRTKEQAKEWARAVETALTDGEHVPSAEAKRRTVRELLERYKKKFIPKKRDQVNPTRYADWWIDRIGDVRLYRLTPDLVADIRDELGEERAPATVNRYLALLSHACTVAEREWKWMPSNPLRSVSRMSEPRGRNRFLTEDEIKSLLEACHESKHPQLYTIVLIAVTSGARRGEIIGLRWRDVDLSKGRAILHETKSGEARTLALIPQVVTELEALRKVRQIDSDLIFPSPVSGKPSYFHFEQAWRAAMDSAGIKDFRFHDLRHTAASYLAMNGASTREIAAVLGHQTLEMVKRYSHLNDEHLPELVGKAADKILPLSS